MVIIMNNNLSLTKIINGLSKTLNIANQMIPLYKQVKPILEKTNELITKQSPSPKEIKTTKEETPTNLPTFFQ